MPILVGAALAVAVGLFATALRLDRDRAFYATVTMVVATYYVLFAAMGGSAATIAVEAAVAAVFIAAAAWGFRTSPWIVVAALAAHGIQDVFHGSLVDNPGVPAFWPGFCMGYDVAAAAYLAVQCAATRQDAVMG